jgi:hypothetical protein
MRMKKGMMRSPRHQVRRVAKSSHIRTYESQSSHPWHWRFQPCAAHSPLGRSFSFSRQTQCTASHSFSHCIERNEHHLMSPSPPLFPPPLLGRRLVVTSALVAQWAASVRSSASLGAMRQLIRAYRLACHYGDAEANEVGETPAG